MEELDQLSYAVQFFDFSAEQLSVERKHQILSLMRDSIEFTVRKIETPATSALLAAQKETVVERMTAACEDGLESLRELDNKTFTWPPHVLQPQDLELEQHKYTSEDEQRAIAEFESLKRQFRENMAMLAELNAENEKYAAMEPLIERELNMQKRVFDCCAVIDPSKLERLTSHFIKD